MLALRFVLCFLLLSHELFTEAYCSHNDYLRCLRRSLRYNQLPTHIVDDQTIVLDTNLYPLLKSFLSYRSNPSQQKVIDELSHLTGITKDTIEEIPIFTLTQILEEAETKFGTIRTLPLNFFLIKHYETNYHTSQYQYVLNLLEQWEVGGSGNRGLSDRQILTGLLLAKHLENATPTFITQDYGIVRALCRQVPNCQESNQSMEFILTIPLSSHPRAQKRSIRVIGLHL